MRNSRVFILVLALSCILAFSLSVASADVPQLINYQGRLTDKTGQPLEGVYDITLKIYDAEAGAGTMAPWEERHAGVNIQKGMFSVLLGSITPLDSLAFDKPYWLEIKIGEDVMSPRQRITSSAYALRANTADKAKDSETVSGIGASSTAAPNKVLPLDGNGKFPAAENLLGNNIVILAGVIKDGQTIPLPDGFTESQCKWMVSYANTTQAQFPAMDGWSWVKCYATGRVVTAKCGGTGPGQGTYPSDANYIIIGIK